MSDKALPPPPTPQIVDHTPPTTSTERCTLYERLSLLNDKSKAAVSKKIDSELEQQNEDPRVKRKKDIAIRIFLLGLLSYVIASVVFIDAVVIPGIEAFKDAHVEAPATTGEEVVLISVGVGLVLGFSGGICVLGSLFGCYMKHLDRWEEVKDAEKKAVIA